MNKPVLFSVLGRMKRTVILIASIVFLIVAVSCAIASVARVEKNDMDMNLNTSESCQNANHTIPAHQKMCYVWKFNECFKGKNDKSGKCVANKDSVAVGLTLAAMIASIMWLVLLVWGLSTRPSKSSPVSPLQTGSDAASIEASDASTPSYVTSQTQEMDQSV